MTQEVKHTPGPWKLVKGAKGWFIKSKDGCVIGGINRPVAAEMVAQCEQNAKLVVSAPEMLDALKAARAVLWSIVPEAGDSRIVGEQLRLIDKTIAKAEAV